MGSKNWSTAASINWVMPASSIFESALHHSGLTRYVLLARSCDADLEDHQIVLSTLWRAHRSWSLAIPAKFRPPVSHDIVLAVATSAWLHNVPELSILTLISFHCLLRRHEKVYGIVNIRETKTCRMAGYAAQQHVLLEFRGISQLVNTSNPQSQTRYINLDIHCCSTLRLFPTTTPQPRRVTPTLHAPRTSRRWSHRSLASIS